MEQFRAGKVGKLRIRVQGNLGEIPADTFVSAINNTLRVLRDLDRRSSSDRRGTLQWVISGLSGGSTVVELDTVVMRGDEDFSELVHRKYVSGIERIARERATPEWFTADDMATIRQLARSLIRQGASGLDFTDTDSNQAAEITRKETRILQELVGTHHKAFGSIEGRIELVSIHRSRRRFNLYHAITNKSIRCNLPEQLEDVVFQAAQDRSRVIVSGLISYNAKGETISVAVNKPIRCLRLEHELPSPEKMLGIAPDITVDLSTEDYVRSLRDG